MSYLQTVVATPVGTISVYLGIGIILLAATWVADAVVANFAKKK